MKKAVLAAAVVLTSTMAFAQNPEGARGGAAAGAATGAVGGAIVGGPVGAVVGGVGGAVVGGIAGDDTPRFKTYVQATKCRRTSRRCSIVPARFPG